MMSLIAGSASSSSSGPRPRSSSTSTFSSANCSRRLRLILSSVSTSPMIGRNSSASSSLDSVAAASGSTRSSRRGSTCSLIRWTEASKPSALLLPCFAAGVLACGQAVHRAHRRRVAVGASDRRLEGVKSSSGGNWSPPSVSPGAGAEPAAPLPFIGLATPKLGRPPPMPLRLPNALMPPVHAVSVEFAVVNRSETFRKD